MEHPVLGSEPDLFFFTSSDTFKTRGALMNETLTKTELTIHTCDWLLVDTRLIPPNTQDVKFQHSLEKSLLD
jgi:hypothetical protein